MGSITILVDACFCGNKKVRFLQSWFKVLPLFNTQWWVLVYYVVQWCWKAMYIIITIILTRVDLIKTSLSSIVCALLLRLKRYSFVAIIFSINWALMVGPIQRVSHIDIWISYTVKFTFPIIANQALHQCHSNNKTAEI